VYAVCSGSSEVLDASHADRLPRGSQPGANFVVRAGTAAAAAAAEPMSPTGRAAAGAPRDDKTTLSGRPVCRPGVFSVVVGFSWSFVRREARATTGQAAPLPGRTTYCLKIIGSVCPAVTRSRPSRLLVPRLLLLFNGVDNPVDCARFDDG